MSNARDEVIEDFNKYNEDPNKTIEVWIEDMNALYTSALYYPVYN